MKRTSNQLPKRLLSFIMVLAMMLSLVPAMVFAAGETDGTTVYLVPNANWKQSDARFAVYYFNDGSNGWADMSDEDGDGVYEGVVPADYTSIIFCRMNPNAAANNWDNKWNQSADLKVPTDGTNCYTVTEDTWDNGGGTWSTYTPALILYLKPNSNWLIDGARFAAYFFGNGEAWVSMTDADGDGYYECEAPEGYPSVIFCRMNPGTTANIWDNKWNQTSDLTVPTDDTNCYTVADGTWDNGGGTWSVYPPEEEEVPETTAPAEPAIDYYLIGYINGADYGCEADYANLGEYKFVDGKLTATFTQDSYVFVKTGDNAHWYMAESYCTDTSVALKEGNTEKMFVPGNTELTFTLVENADGTLTLSYTKAAAETPEFPEGHTVVTIHFLKAEGWGSNINAYVWTAGGALAGYEDYNTWPGKAIGANAEHAGWYDLIVGTETPTAFNFIFNDGGNQTSDLATGEITGDTELWVVGNDVMTTAPGEWSGDYDYTANIYFQKPEGWGDTINAWIWDANGAIPGYEQFQTTWPGSPIEADPVNAGWYTVSVTMDENTGFSFILNDGSNQTADLSTGTLNVTTNIWVVEGKVQYNAPEGFVDPNRKIYVPGTFPGPSWDASSNQMTYDSELGLYVYTFEDVPAANYEFKIAINGGWAENYGAGGVKDGSNIAVTVPKTMDVTVYYNDQSHNAVTNVNYVFAEVTLTGSGVPNGTKLTDKGLTGIYSVTIPMTDGTYTDYKLVYDDGEAKEYCFNEFTLEEDKNVTFYFDPITGLYYHNASNIPIDAASIYFNSQDETYKSPYGAVATGEEVAFSIQTGKDVTSAVLVIKGVESVPMTRNEETGLWTATATINNLGEYDYYFALSNGSAVQVYGDDDGYYGEGKVCELTEVMPYDLVVYKTGYETPDWIKDAVIYQIFPDRFYDGDETNNQAQTWARGEVDYEYISEWYTLPENPEQEALVSESVYKATGAWYGDGQWSNEIYGGDLQGIIERIDYLEALGVNVIYLNPVFWSISNHRYDAVDYTKIDPILGTEGDFADLVAAAEARGMHIILDGVFNHVSDDSVYFDRYYKYLTADGFDGKIGAYPYWAYVYDYMDENGASQTDAEAAAKTYFTNTYGVNDYSYTEWFAVSGTTMAGTVDNIGLRAGKEVYSYEGWWGYDSMPVIYSTNGSEYQTGNWAEEIIYNKDNTSVTQYWITKGNDGWRLDVANEVSDETWQHFRNSVKALNSDVVIIGEIWDDATKYLMGDMYDSVMNYMFRSAVTSYAMGTSAEDTTKAMEKIRERYPEEAFYAMMNLVGSHDTTRILSYLDGIGDDRADKSLSAAFPTYEGTSATAKARQYLVSFLQFTYAGAPTIYYGDEIGMVGSDDPDDRRAFEWGQGNQELVQWYAKLAAIREAYPALRTGSVEVIDTEDSNLMGYIRTDENNTLTVIANNADNSKTIELEGTYVDLISGKTFTDTVTVPARNGVILVAEDETKTITINTEALAPAYDSAYTVGKRCDGEHHTYASVITAPTCTEKGYTTYTCSCGDSYVADYVDATGHSYTDGVCSVCGEKDPDYVEPEEPTEKPTEEPTQEPTTKPAETTAPTEKPEETSKPTEKPTETTAPSTDDNADTGDNSMVLVWSLLLVLSAAGICLAVVLGIRSKKRQ